MIPWLLFLAIETCIPVHGDRIRAADFARATAAFTGVAPDVAVALAPSPGLERRFPARHVASLAQSLGGDPAAASPACFVLDTVPLDAARVREAIERTLAPVGPLASFELVDLPRAPVPAGELDFDLRGLGASSAAGSLWRGRIRYAEHRSLPIWVRVRLSVTAAVVVVRSRVEARAPIAAENLLVETRAVDPLALRDALRDPSGAVGHEARTALASGTLLLRSALGPALAVRRGQTVAVEATHGQATVAVEGTAETGGRTGDPVWVKTGLGGKPIQARIRGAGRVEAGADR